MRRIILAAGLFALASSSAGATNAGQPVDPTQQALAQMVQEAQGREASALVQVYSQRAQLAALQARLDAETKRADEAEAKLRAAEMPANAKP